MKSIMRHKATGKSSKAKVFSVVLFTALFPLSFSAEGQQTAKIPRIGFLTLLASPDSLESVFLQGLHDLGYIDGQNIAIEYRRAAGKVKSLPQLAEGLVGLKVDLIVVRSTPVVEAAKNATTTIPIVMMGVGAIRCGAASLPASRIREGTLRGCPI